MEMEVKVLPIYIGWQRALDGSKHLVISDFRMSH